MMKVPEKVLDRGVFNFKNQIRSFDSGRDSRTEYSKSRVAKFVPKRYWLCMSRWLPPSKTCDFLYSFKTFECRFLNRTGDRNWLPPTYGEGSMLTSSSLTVTTTRLRMSWKYFLELHLHFLALWVRDTSLAKRLADFTLPRK
jgi:hypothetical protein